MQIVAAACRSTTNWVHSLNLNSWICTKNDHCKKGNASDYNNYHQLYPISHHTYYILVKAPLRVLYDKIQHEGWGRVANTARGEAECCTCHETTPRVLYFIVQHEYTVLLLICWCCVGGLITSTRSESILDCCFQCWRCFDRMDSQSDTDKQTDPVVSPLLLRYSIRMIVVHHRR